MPVHIYTRVFHYGRLFYGWIHFLAKHNNSIHLITPSLTPQKMLEVGVLATRIMNIYQFYQANIFLSFLCKDETVYNSFQNKLEKEKFDVRGISLRNIAVQSILQHEHNLKGGIGVLGQTAVLLCLTEIISLYYEFSQNPSFT